MDDRVRWGMGDGVGWGMDDGSRQGRGEMVQDNRMKLEKNVLIHENTRPEML